MAGVRRAHVAAPAEIEPARHLLSGRCDRWVKTTPARYAARVSGVGGGNFHKRHLAKNAASANNLRRVINPLL